MPSREWEQPWSNATRPRASCGILEAMERSAPQSVVAATGGTVDILALIDMSNVGPRARSDRDYEELMYLLADMIRRQTLRAGYESVDVEARLYGGFYDRMGSPTEQHVRAQRSVKYLTGLSGKVRIRGRLVTALACLPNAQLVGTYKNKGQKMVDQMLASDALHFARSGEFERILLIADDDDYVPAALVISIETSSNLSWVRKRTHGTNDGHFDLSVVDFSTDAEWR